ncbi:MAG: hypothetical protein KF686_05545 [Ramlibacter sp.]|nr:hypothetical protein [Ramlibacter sp.]
MKTLTLTAALAALASPWAAQAQSSCSSDGQPRPLQLMERFINADCASCWSDPATPQPARGALALDWIVPGSRADDAPLSAAARRDGLDRLAALGRAVPLEADSALTPVRRGQRRLRVAHGLPFNDYVGTAIELKPGTGGPWKAWLALVETVPAGTEGTPVERNLVRNTLQPAWDGDAPLSKAQQKKLYEARPMLIPEGTRADRLRVVGWVEDAKGRIQFIAQSACVQKP